MGKWIAMVLLGCGLIGSNVYQFNRIQSLEEKLDANRRQVNQLGNSTQAGFNEVGADVGGLRRQLDFRFAQVDSKQRALEARIDKVEKKVKALEKEDRSEE